MNRKSIFNITFFFCIICGLIYFYYLGKNGHVGRTQVLYAVTNEALPFFIIERLLIVWFPISVLIADCVEDLWPYHSKDNYLFRRTSKKVFLYRVFFIYVFIVITKILQLYYCGEYLITTQGELQYYPPCPLNDALLYVVHLSRLGRHVCWICDSFAVSYLITKEDN